MAGIDTGNYGANVIVPLHDTIKEFVEASGKTQRTMIRLTISVVVLTIVMAALGGIQIAATLGWIKL